MINKILFQINRILPKLLFATIAILAFAPASQAQQRAAAVIAGTVEDPDGEPVEFAAVYVKDTQNGTQTTVSGKFTLEVEPGTVTVGVQSLGYKPYEKTVRVGRSGRVELRVRLQEGENSLGELVVEGQSPVKRVNRSAYNVVAINAEALHNRALNLINHRIRR